MNNENLPKFNPFNLFLPKDITNYGIVLTALKLELFEVLNENFLTVKEIKEKLEIKVKERNLVDFLDKLYFNNHLIREGNDITNFKYKNAHDHLLKSNPDNFIPLLNMTERISKRFDGLPFMMKEAKFPTETDIFSELFSNEQKAKDFLRTMGLLQKENFEMISKGYDFSSYKKFVDIGGCLGNFSVAMKKNNPHLTCVSFDLPFVESHARKYLTERNMSNEIELVSGDMFKDDFPKCDIIAMGNILHDWNEEKKKLLLKKAYDCVNDKGIMIIVEMFISDNRDADDYALDISCLMILECLDGFNFTRNEMETYAKEAGFSKVEFLKEKIEVDAAILYK
jgi:hypothetical protein